MVLVVLAVWTLSRGRDDGVDPQTVAPRGTNTATIAVDPDAKALRDRLPRH